EDGAHAGKNAFLWSGLVNLIQEMADIGVVKTLEDLRRARQPVVRRHMRHDPGVGAAGHGNGGHAVLQAEYVLERSRHGAASSAAGQHQRPVDIEQNQFCGHDQNLNLLERASVNRPLAPSSVSVLAATAVANSVSIVSATAAAARFSTIARISRPKC